MRHAPPTPNLAFAKKPKSGLQLEVLKLWSTESSVRPAREALGEKGLLSTVLPQEESLA